MCNDFKPDVEAQCDCINCGEPYEKHRKPSSMVKFWPAIVTEQVKQVVKSVKRHPLEGCEVPEDFGRFNYRDQNRKPQTSLTVTVSDRFGNLSPATIMIPGETPVSEIGQAIIEAVKTQTVNDGTGIFKATIGPDEIYNV